MTSLSDNEKIDHILRGLEADNMSPDRLRETLAATMFYKSKFAHEASVAEAKCRRLERELFFAKKNTFVFDNDARVLDLKAKQNQIASDAAFALSLSI
jgi:hypothetical protein